MRDGGQEGERKSNFFWRNYYQRSDKKGKLDLFFFLPSHIFQLQFSRNKSYLMGVKGMTGAHNLR